jgi:hypothetical protein
VGARSELKLDQVHREPNHRLEAHWQWPLMLHDPSSLGRHTLLTTYHANHIEAHAVRSRVAKRVQSQNLRRGTRSKVLYMQCCRNCACDLQTCIKFKAEAVEPKNLEGCIRSTRRSNLWPGQVSSVPWAVHCSAAAVKRQYIHIQVHIALAYC